MLISPPLTQLGRRPVTSCDSVLALGALQQSAACKHCGAAPTLLPCGHCWQHGGFITPSSGGKGHEYVVTQGLSWSELKSLDSSSQPCAEPHFPAPSPAPRVWHGRGPSGSPPPALGGNHIAVTFEEAEAWEVSTSLISRNLGEKELPFMFSSAWSQISYGWAARACPNSHPNWVWTSWHWGGLHRQHHIQQPHLSLNSTWCTLRWCVRTCWAPAA